MKSDKTMAEDILERVSVIETKKAHRKKTFYKATASLGAFALILVAAFTFLNNTPAPLPSSDESLSPIETTAPAIRKGFSFVVANAAETDENYEVWSFRHESNMALPLGGILLVKDITGMSSDSISRIPHELHLRLEEIYGENDTFSVRGNSAPPTAIYFGTIGKMAVKTEDASALQSIEISCSDTGKVTIQDISSIFNSDDFLESFNQGKYVSVSGEEYAKRYDNEEGMYFYWLPSEETEALLIAEPQTDLSTITDTITVKVNYTDGTSEQFTLTLSFDDEGILTSTYNYN
ncbi:MAG: hypothetical protein IKL10_01715 [Clostridia bacterium]|nr:hypothetical protein [Clostridia bacterium]